MAVRLPYHVLRNPRLMRARYGKKTPTMGAIPYEIGLHDRHWERKLGTDTGGWVAVELEDGMLYEATPFLLLQDILQHLALTQMDVFVDLGCGKGRATCMAARTEVGRVVGVEQDDGFLSVARANLSGMPGGQAQVDFHHGLAQDFDFDTTTVVFLFNPFGAVTLKEVVELLRRSLERAPRRLRIVYVNPVHEQVLADCGWLENTVTWPSGAYSEFEIQPPNPRLVSFWEACL
jgi:predicted RNA methylase